ncbi:hypothetical protein ACF059_13965 [Streptomyces sp. NPDC016562]|uniref:hypothetical protein n=1 Tax=Streptomyces sp. NPDC016562 TaxID=3364966 RepID=UPI0036F96510
MTLEEGQRVKLAADLRLDGSLAPAWDGGTDGRTDGGAAADAVPGSPPLSLSLASGTEGTVERVNAPYQQQSQEVREYVRLKSLLDDFGHQMPPGTRKQLAEQVLALEPAWVAYQGRRLRVTVRVRLDNGFVLDDAPEGLLAPA